MTFVCAGSTAFQHLQTILLRDNILSSWGDVDSLNRLISLTDLRLSGNPILNDARGGGRYEVGVHALLHNAKHAQHNATQLV
jgi:hypothetical protein